MEDLVRYIVWYGSDIAAFSSLEDAHCFAACVSAARGIFADVHRLNGTIICQYLDGEVTPEFIPLPTSFQNDLAEFCERAVVDVRAIIDARHSTVLR